MGRNQPARTEQDLKQIADMLLLNGTLTECPGLVHGKTGIAIFFFRYALYTGDDLFADYAMDLIGGMLHQIHANSPADDEKGLAGIGVGIDYMIRNDFLSVEDDICEDFDDRMYRAVMYDPRPDFSRYNGLTGYGRYWMTRLQYQEPSKQARECLRHITAQMEDYLPDISNTEQTDVYCFLHDLREIPGFDHCAGLLEQCRMIWDVPSSNIVRGLPRLGNTAVGNIIRMYQSKRYFNAALQDEIDLALQQIPDLDMDKVPVSMGLLAGYAGEGMLRLTALRQTDDSWIFLL